MLKRRMNVYFDPLSVRQIMPMELMGFQHGEFDPTPIWFSKLKISVHSSNENSYGVSSGRKKGLSDRGFDVTRLNTCNTIPVQGLDQEILKQALSAPVVAVASPSAVRAWVNLLPKSESWGKCVVCIGQTTALAAKKLGLKNVYYPNNPGLDGWVGSILEALKIHGEIQKPKDMVDFLVLINQVICKFGASMESILEEIFPAIASKIFLIFSSDVFPSGPGSNTEEIRELQELQRISYSFIHVMVTHDLSSVFLAQNSRGYLDAIMQLLLLTSCSHKDVLVRKFCVQIFVRLIKDWCSKDIGEDKVPGFRSFIIEKFATNCCLYSVLDKSFEFHDANTLVLFGEIVLAQKVMYEKLGGDFISHFVPQGLLTAHCPRDSAEKYYQHLQGNDSMAFKSFYQSLIANLRQQQNGSLVFR